MIRVVVTGATGFLGHHLVASLAKTGMTVIPVSRRNSRDITCIEDYRKTPAGDVLIHLAEEPSREKVNLIGREYLNQTANVLKTLSANSNQTVIYASSSIVYGDASRLSYKVDAPVYAQDTYTQSKIQNEEIVLNSGGIVVRISNLYGLGMSKLNVMSKILSQLPGSGPLIVYDDQPIRDYLHVSDAVSALMILVTTRFNGLVNLGTGVGTSVRRLAELALNFAKQTDRTIVATAPSHAFSRNVLDITETVQLFRWQPRICLEEQFPGLFFNHFERD